MNEKIKIGIIGCGFVGGARLCAGGGRGSAAAAGQKQRPKRDESQNALHERRPLSVCMAVSNN